MIEKCRSPTYGLATDTLCFKNNQLSDPNVSIEEEKDKKTFLIVGPASVLYNWVDEFETWGYFTVG